MYWKEESIADQISQRNQNQDEERLTRIKQDELCEFDILRKFKTIYTKHDQDIWFHFWRIERDKWIAFNTCFVGYVLKNKTWQESAQAKLDWEEAHRNLMAIERIHGRHK